MPQLREAVLRDLGWLLNTSARAGFERVEEFPEVSRSVLNYGIPDLCGTTASGVVDGELERVVRRAIQLYEPRVLQRGLSIKLIRGSSPRGPTFIMLEITGEIWGDPVPERLYIRTELDLDTGECVVPGGGGRG